MTQSNETALHATHQTNHEDVFDRLLSWDADFDVRAHHG